MGVVFRARDDQLRRDLAIKVFSGATVDDSVERVRLLREARSAASLNHPNICTIYEIGEAEGQVYIAMELVNGLLLSEHLHSGGLPHDQVLRLGLQVADAVGHAHERGIVHRDLKSLNVIVTPEGRCKVLDFGLARRLPDETETVHTMLTEAGAIVGTPAYMAPEQIRGETVDARTDVWALGVMLYEMLAGVRPFAGKTPFEVTSAILNQQPPALPSKVPVALKAVVERCLEKRPQDRYADATGIRTELESIQQGMASNWSARARRLRRRPVLVALFSGVLLLLLGILFMPRAVRDRIAAMIAPGIETIAVLPLENRSGDPSQDYLADGITDGLIAELSKLSALKGVIGRTSVMRYKGTTKSLTEIAKELGVQILIEGSVMGTKDEVSVDVRVIDPANGRTLGSVSRERPLQNYHQFQNEIVNSIAQQMRLRMLPDELERLQQIRQVDPDVVDWTLKGMTLWYKHNLESIEMAQQYFEKALEKDPQYAPAYAGLMWVWTYRGSATVRPREVVAGMEKIHRRMREQGVTFDETQAEVFEANADIAFNYLWDWEEAEKNYLKAIQLTPNSVGHRLFYWDYLASMNRMAEARAVIERAQQLDPFSPLAQGQYGLYLLLDRRFDDAITEFNKMLNQKIDFDLAHSGLATAYHHKGMFAEAFRETKAAFEGVPGMTELLDDAYKQDGYAGALHLFADLMSAQDVTYILPTNIARLYAYAGDKDMALTFLEKAFDDKDSGLVHLQVDPDWDTLRKEPRFMEVLRKMSFPK